MNPEDIISQDSERNGYRPGAVMHGILDAVQKRQALIFHDNKTVIVLDPLNKGSNNFEIELFTVDSPIGLVRSLKNMLANEAPKLPAQSKIYVDSKSSQVAKLMQQSGIPLQKSDKPKFTWMLEA